MRRMRNRNSKGFTIAELLIVVGIIIVLLLVGFLSVARYQRGTTLREMDGIAKELFVAAQNHLSMADSQGLLLSRAANAGTPLTDSGGVYPDGSDVRYFIVPADSPEDTASVLNLMLPPTAVDEMVRSGGSYIIFYEYSTARVLDVFYVQNGGNYGRDLSSLNANDLKALLTSYRFDEGKSLRRNYSGAVIGWYGGTAAQALPAIPPLNDPDFTVHNGDKLYVTVKNTNLGNTNASLRLIVRSTVSKNASGEPNEVCYDLVRSNSEGTSVSSNPDSKANMEVASGDASFTVTLDDVTDPAMHFATLLGGAGFIPGEDVEISVMAHSISALVTPVTAGPIKANSLFSNDTSFTLESTIYKADAKIASIRHLENLSKSISNVNASGAAVQVATATQTDDLSWPAFLTSFSGDVSVYNYDDSSKSHGTNANCFYPVTPGYGLSYEGGSHSITGVTVNTAGNAGLFGELNSGLGSHVSNLKLENFSITATGDSASAGALAGTLSGTDGKKSSVTNVLALNSSTSATIHSAKSAGGLVGTATYSDIVKCASTLCVEGATAGGLLGTAGAGTTITASYAAGHTDNGEYYNHNGNGARTTEIYSVTGTTVGGLVGAAGAAKIESSYSTCSVSGVTAGGLVGTASGVITSCYATGLVSGTSAEGAFAGSYSGTATNCKYYKIINERPASNGFTYLGPVANAAYPNVTALDETAGDYDTFLGAQSAWTAEDAFDTSLDVYFALKYPLRSVSRLGASDVSNKDYVYTHFGDWPAPEQSVIN